MCVGGALGCSRLVLCCAVGYGTVSKMSDNKKARKNGQKRPGRPPNAPATTADWKALNVSAEGTVLSSKSKDTPITLSVVVPNCKLSTQGTPKKARALQRHESKKREAGRPTRVRVVTIRVEWQFGGLVRGVTLLEVDGSRTGLIPADHAVLLFDGEVVNVAEDAIEASGRTRWALNNGKALDTTFITAANAGQLVNEVAPAGINCRCVKNGTHGFGLVAEGDLRAGRQLFTYYGKDYKRSYSLREGPVDVVRRKAEHAERKREKAEKCTQKLHAPVRNNGRPTRDAKTAALRSIAELEYNTMH